MTGILVTFTQGGVQAQGVESFEEARRLATEFADKEHPGVETFEGHLLKSWWLVEDDGAPFFRPKPWPIAGYFPNEGLKQTFPEGTPPWIAFIAVTPMEFITVGFASKEDALADFNKKAVPEGFLVGDTANGGIQVKWKSPEGKDEFIVAYAFAFTAA